MLKQVQHDRVGAFRMTGVVVQDDRFRIQYNRSLLFRIYGVVIRDDRSRWFRMIVVRTFGM